ncbi:hypothetical protein [Shewanella mangrovisoli]|uniref:hypothetical protein n=1 Tax=Shewanella mangrovisoli TaxID=2864211 RepID=UPI00313ED35B
MSRINGWLESVMKSGAFLALICFGFGWILEALINTSYGLSIDASFNYKYVISGALYLVFILTPPLLIILMVKSFSISLNFFLKNFPNVGVKDKFFIFLKSLLLLLLFVLISISMYIYPLFNAWHLFLGVNVNVISMYCEVVSISYVFFVFAVCSIFFEWRLNDKFKDYIIFYAIGMLCLSIVPYSIYVNSNIPSNFGGSKARAAMIFPNDELVKQLKILGYEISANKSIKIVVMMENDKGILIGSKTSEVKTTFLKWDTINSISFLK